MRIFHYSSSLFLLILILILRCSAHKGHEQIPHINMSGEVTATSAMLQSRLVAADTMVLEFEDDVAGRQGYGYFEWSQDSTFANSSKSNLRMIDGSSDFIIKESIGYLQPNTPYFYRLWRGISEETLVPGETSTFITLPGATSTLPVSFAVMSCMHLERFFGLDQSGGGGDGKFETAPLSDWERSNGFPAFRTMKEMRPLFVVATGDNVYYDHILAETPAQLRAKWHRQFSVPTLREILQTVPFYWEKDDHDYRFDDADTTNDKRELPSHELGVRTFREQVPIDSPYKTVRVNANLQVWLVEGRDFRSPNLMPDGPGKSLWGREQLGWLKETLLASDAAFKILISPTPLIGPDDARKRDNHANTGGFRYERDQFFDWLDENGLTTHFMIINGDRHWQYHSVGPYGINEFGTGALVRQNARYGRQPGDPKSTDPEGEIVQPFIQMEPTGGFVWVAQQQQELSIQILNAEGELLYSYSFDAVN